MWSPAGRRTRTSSRAIAFCSLVSSSLGGTGRNRAPPGPAWTSTGSKNARSISPCGICAERK